MQSNGDTCEGFADHEPIPCETPVTIAVFRKPLIRKSPRRLHYGGQRTDPRCTKRSGQRQGCRSRGPHGHLLIVEAPDLAGDLVETVLDRKVPRVEPVHFRMGKILEVRLATLAREEDVVLSPENDRLGLLLSEESLQLRVKLCVRPIVIEIIELDPPRVGSIEIMQIMFQLSGLISSGLRWPCV